MNSKFRMLLYPFKRYNYYLQLVDRSYYKDFLGQIFFYKSKISKSWGPTNEIRMTVYDFIDLIDTEILYRLQIVY